MDIEYGRFPCPSQSSQLPVPVPHLFLDFRPYGRHISHVTQDRVSGFCVFTTDQSRRVLEAAWTLGASPRDAFFTVALPLAARGYLTAAVLTFAGYRDHQFTLTQGAPRRYTSSPGVVRSFCGAPLTMRTCSRL